MGGECSTTPRVTNSINRCPQDTPTLSSVMKYYTSTTEYNCGIDLHARQMYVCVMDRQGKKLVHTNVKDNDFQYFLKLIAPYKHSLTVCCECMFGWYWLADACQAAGLNFVLAHALYVRAIHGGKNKNDRVDSEKLTHLLRSNLIPPAYVYPTQQRPLRALLRQRIFYVCVGPNCWPASIAINWPTIASRPSRVAGPATTGKNSCSKPNSILCANWP